MNVNTGQAVSVSTLDEAFLDDDWVRVIGTPEAVATLSRNVRIGAGVKDKRRARTKAQRASRKRNR